MLGKVALVTGAARGIGKAIALRLAEDGVNVAVADICGDSPGVEYHLSDIKLLEQTRDELIKIGRRSLAIKADVTREADVKRMVEDILNQWGRIDILVNNAGVGASCPVSEMSPNGASGLTPSGSRWNHRPWCGSYMPWAEEARSRTAAKANQLVR